MTIARNYYRVYTKSAWDGNAATWQLRHDLDAVSATRLAAPGSGIATFRKRYGAGYDSGTGLIMEDGALLTSLSGLFVRITRADNADGGGEQMLWCGYFPAEGYDILGQSAAGAKTADQLPTAVELDWLFNRRINRAWTIDADSALAGPCPIIDGTPSFNRRTKTGGIVGNKSGEKYRTDADGAFAESPAGIESYVFEAADYLAGTPFALWSSYDIIEYLARFLPTALAVTFQIPAGEQLALQAIKPVLDPAGKTAKQILNELMPPGRGLGWCVVVGLDDSVTVKIYSLLDAELTVGAVTIPVHHPDDRVLLDAWLDSEKTRITIDGDSSGMVDSITVTGAPIRACGTFAVKDETLEPDWSGDSHDLYRAGASGEDIYDTLTADEKKFYNDRFRDSDRLSKVFTAFRVPKDFNWIVQNALPPSDPPVEGENDRRLNPKWDPETGAFVSPEASAPYWNADKRFLPHLPFRENFAYDGDTPVNYNLSGTEPQWRPCFALIQRAGKWEYADHMSPRTATVQPMTDQPGINVRFSPAYLLGLTKWFLPTPPPPEEPPPPPEPGQLTDGQLVAEGDPKVLSEAVFNAVACDYNELIVTAMIDTDQVFARRIDYGTGFGREIEIAVPDAELWWVTAGTVFDIGPDGQLKRFACTEKKLRDDSAVLESILAAAAAWYGRRRYRATVTHARVEPIAELGTLLVGLDTDGNGSHGSCVSAISYDFTRGAVTLTASVVELDLPAVFGRSSSRSGGASGRSGPVLPSSASSGVSEMVALRRRLDLIEKDLSLPKRPGGVFTAAGGGGGGIPAEVIVTVERPNLITGTPGVSRYVCRLSSDSTANWLATTEYFIGDMAIAAGTEEGTAEEKTNRKYKSLTGTKGTGEGGADEPNVGNDPSTETYDEETGNSADGNWHLEKEIDPSPRSTEGDPIVAAEADLNQFKPDFEVGDTVKLEKVGDAYFFAETLFKTQDGPSGLMSISYDKVTKRVIAVFA